MPEGTLDSEKAWPRWSKPFMYGYGNVPKNLLSGDDVSAFAARSGHQHDAAAARSSGAAACGTVDWAGARPASAGYCVDAMHGCRCRCRWQMP